MKLYRMAFLLLSPVFIFAADPESTVAESDAEAAARYAKAQEECLRANGRRARLMAAVSAKSSAADARDRQQRDLRAQKERELVGAGSDDDAKKKALRDALRRRRETLAAGRRRR